MRGETVNPDSSVVHPSVSTFHLKLDFSRHKVGMKLPWDAMYQLPKGGFI